MPSIHIYLKRFERNLRFLTNLLHAEDRSVMAVSKVFLADSKLIDIINQTEIEYIADSRIENLRKIQTDKPKVMLRIPAISEVNDIVEVCDISLNSEYKTIESLNQASEKIGKIHKIILMFDIGDLREGIYYKDFELNLIKKIQNLSFIELYGIGTNLTCYGGVIPTKETYEKLIQIKEQIELRFGLTLKVISGGNSSAIPMLKRHELSPFINNLRIGEAYVLGRETAYGTHIEGMADDVFTLQTEIVELKDKPSYPEGELGLDAFGKKVEFVDRGMMRRAICNVGKQDVDLFELIPPDGVEILGGSSDHLILNLSNKTYKLGDTIEFKLTYRSLLSLMTSPYIGRVYEEL
ncbi:MAG: alanine/ornithine racemase family PLP-dependent enzyme [Acholeplasmataceae bacterium]|nr:alanine/ornithine racemase family PLP-dependent enzyme [Acholeplasmataceae bacterium]